MAEEIKISEADPTSSLATPILIEDQQNNVNWEIERKNPLQNPLVLVEVFKNLSHKNLKNCRLVNKLWRSEATPIVIRKTLVDFGAYDYAYDYGPGNLEFSPERIGRYLVEMRDFGNDDFEIYLKKDMIGNYLGTCMKLFDDFLPCLGSQIKSLCLMLCLKEVPDFEIFRQIVKLVPNVKELTLELEMYGPVQNYCGFSDLTANVKQLEKVRKLDLTYYLNPKRTENNQNVERDILVDIDKLFSKFVVKLVPKLESIIIRDMDFSNILLEYASVANLEECKISEIEIHTWFPDIAVWKNEILALADDHDHDHNDEDQDHDNNDEDHEMLDNNDEDLDHAILAILDNKEILAILCRWPTPLRKLHYYSNATCVEKLDAKGLENLLRKHAPSLEDIEISITARKEFEQMQQIIMPTFPKLTHLNILNPSTSNSCKLHFIFHSTFEQHFPMLKVEYDKLVEMFAKLM